MLLTLDRFEGKYAVMEIRDIDPSDFTSDDTMDLEKSLLPPGSKEGDIFEYDGAKLTPRPDLTAEARKQIQVLFERLRKKT